MTEPQAWPIESVTPLDHGYYRVTLKGSGSLIHDERELAAAGITPPPDPINFDTMPDTPTDSDTAARARALLDAYPEDVFRPLADTVAHVMLSNGQMATSDAFAAHVLRTIALPVITDLLAERDAAVSAGAVARTVAMSHIAAERDVERAGRERAEAEARQLREAIEDRLRQVLAVHGQFLGDWDEWTSLGALEGYNGLTVTARTALAHLHGRHDDSPLPTMHCVLCETFRVPAVAEGAEE